MPIPPVSSRTPADERERFVRPDATCQLQLEDLREANEFDQKLLESEGIRFGGVRLRGAWLLSKSREQAVTPTRGSMRQHPLLAWLFRSKN